MTHTSVAGVIRAATTAFRETEAVDMLTRSAELSLPTRGVVRKAIQRALDQGRELDRLQARFREISAELDELGPCIHRMAGADSSGCRYCDLMAAESTVTRRIDDVRRMLGAIP